MNINFSLYMSHSFMVSLSFKYFFINYINIYVIVVVSVLYKNEYMSKQYFRIQN